MDAPIDDLKNSQKARLDILYWMEVAWDELEKLNKKYDELCSSIAKIRKANNPASRA